MGNAKCLILPNRFICIERQKNLKSFLLEIFDKLADVNNELTSYIRFLNSFGDQEGVLLIEETKATVGLLSRAAIRSEDC